MKGFQQDRQGNGGEGKEARRGRESRTTCLWGTQVGDLRSRKNRGKTALLTGNSWVRNRKVGLSRKSALNGGLAVVGSGEDVGDPDGDEPSIGESLVEGVCREVSVEDLGEFERDEESQEQGQIIDAFVGQFEGGVPGGAPTKAGGESPRCIAVGGPAERCRRRKVNMGTIGRLGQDIMPSLLNI